MDKGIEVEYLDLSNLTSYDSFVFIYVNVGNMSHTSAKKYIGQVQKDLKLCRKLEDREIDYVIVACREGDTNNITTQITHKHKNDVVMDYDEAFKVME